MPSVKPYSSVEVCELTGLTYRQLDYYCRTGVFGKEFWDQRQGSGTYRQFTDADLAGVEAVAAAVRRQRAILAAVKDGSTFREGRDAFTREHQEATT